MKLLACLLLLIVLPQGQNILTVDQVLAWRTYYGLPLDKDLSEAIKIFGQPNESIRSTRIWNPSSRTGFRAVTIELGQTSTQGFQTVLRVTVFPHPNDVFTVNDLLRSPERFIFESGSNKQGSYFSAETRTRDMKLFYACSGNHDPQFQSVVIKSTKSPDDEL